MKLYKTVLIIFFFFNLNIAHSNESIYFIDLDKLVKNSNLGKKTLAKIENLNKKNIENLKIKNNELKKRENEIKTKQNVVSKEELDKEINILRNKINEFKIIKDQMVLDFEKKKNENMNNLFLTFNPIIQDYMKKNSIDILLESKNVFIGKNNLDITNDIIKEVNVKFKNE
ncbi:OmpH family outer membrane protein [Candidatus Pelagibacter communis]|uniref:OmpH family outer membrane protein n=1 Tax=Pelagibacter ubique TaxID=198252 RepID=UPI00094D5863|nr:OmpH family outer membrane protein [Candidatus Pelagibacter ubique]